jgi:hypothetical protein
MNAVQHDTRSLNYAMQSAMEQLGEQVKKVCTTNEKTEKRLQSLMDRIDNINVSLVSSYICIFYNNIAYRLLQQK